MNTVVQEINDIIKESKLIELSAQVFFIWHYRKLSALTFGKQLPQYLQIIHAEVIFLFSAIGMPNKRIVTENLTLFRHNNLCGGVGGVGRGQQAISEIKTKCFEHVVKSSVIVNKQ